MILQKSLFQLTSFSLALSLGLGTLDYSPTLARSQSNSLQPKLISLQFRPPNVGKPPSTAGGASRGISCLQNKKSIVPVIPTDILALTVEKHPTFFLYLPASTAQTANFILVDEDKDEVIYEQTLKLANKPGIVSISIPTTTNKPLEIGKMYHWYVDILCDTKDPENNPGIEGWVKRIQPNRSLANQLKNAIPSARPALYAKAGIWQETITSLAQLRRSRPNDARLTAEWEELLKSVGLSSIAKEPLVECCQSSN